VNEGGGGGGGGGGGIGGSPVEARNKPQDKRTC